MIWTATAGGYRPPTTHYTPGFPSPATGMGRRLEGDDDSNTSDVPGFVSLDSASGELFFNLLSDR